MDDFLHNLRSGKLKQQDRGRSYNDPQYKSSQRRGAMDRRKKELETFERLDAVKAVLETIAETQKHMAQAYDERTQAENRKAHAMEVLAKNIYRMLNPDATDVDALFAPEVTQVAAPVVTPEATPVAAPVVTPEAAPEVTPEATIQPDKAIDVAPESTETKTDDGPKKLTTEQREALFTLIGEMRAAGNKWEKIARHIASEGYPTASGRASWRGVMAKNLYEKMLAQ